MGCELGKFAKGPREDPDSELNRPPVNNQQTDPRLPLTAKQKYGMIASWKGIARAMGPTGVYMFIKLFEEHQDLLDLFSKFKELKTKEAQANSMELAEHATKVMNTLDEGIKQLDNLDSFFQYLTNVGATHRKIPGFKPEYFWKIESPFLEAVKTTLGDRYTENIENIYKITIKLIIESLVNGYNSSENKPLQGCKFAITSSDCVLCLTKKSNNNGDQNEYSTQLIASCLHRLQASTKQG